MATQTCEYGLPIKEVVRAILIDPQTGLPVIPRRTVIIPASLIKRIKEQLRN